MHQSVYIMDKRLTADRSNSDFQSSKNASSNSLDSDSKSSSLNSKHGVDTMVRSQLHATKPFIAQLFLKYNEP